jgi:hypothetical protein
LPASPPMEIRMNEFWQKVSDVFLPSRTIVVGPQPVVVAPSLSAPVVIGPAEQSTIVIGPAQAPQVSPTPVIHVEPPPRGFWSERGWVRVSAAPGQQLFEGDYQIFERRSRLLQKYPGRIAVRHRDINLFIANPPPGLKAHPKGPCFTLTDPPWFRLHWHHPARTVDDAILYMERILDEVIN